MSKFILLPISKGLSTKIDVETYERLIADGHLKWNAQLAGKRYYVSKNTGHRGSEKLYLHRYIMNAQPGLVIDHIDRDSLNNTKENLRLCYHRDNSRNKGGTRATGFKGVGKYGAAASWVAQISFGGEHVCLGSFEREEDAAKVYDIVSVILFGDFAVPNFQASLKFLKLRTQFIKELNQT